MPARTLIPAHALAAAVMVGTLSAWPLLHAGTRETTAPSDAIGIIQLPRSVHISGGSYVLPPVVTIRASSANERNVAAFARESLATRGTAATVMPSAHGAHLELAEHARDMCLGSEGYRLRVGDDGIRVSANGGAGLFYGLQTFQQLFPVGTSNAIPEVNITDRPEYRWRGIHLDVGRHFFPVAVVEKYLDVAAHY